MNKTTALSIASLMALILVVTCLSASANLAINESTPSSDTSPALPLPPNHGTIHIILTGYRDGMPGAKVKIDWYNSPDDGGYEETVWLNKFGLYEAVLSGAAGDHDFTLTPVIGGYHGETKTFFIPPVSEIYRFMKVYRNDNYPLLVNSVDLQSSSQSSLSSQQTSQQSTTTTTTSAASQSTTSTATTATSGQSNNN